MNIVDINASKSHEDIEYEWIVSELAQSYDRLKSAVSELELSKASAMIKYLQWKYETLVEY